MNEIRKILNGNKEEAVASSKAVSPRIEEVRKYTKNFGKAQERNRAGYDMQQNIPAQPSVKTDYTEKINATKSQLGETIRSRNSNTPVGTAANMAKISELQVQEAQLKVEQNAKRVQEVQQQEQRISQQMAKLETTRQGLEKLMADYQATGSDVTYQAYMIAYADYNKQMEAYNKEYAAYQKNAKVYDDYNASLLKYEKTYAGYEKTYAKYAEEYDKYTGPGSAQYEERLRQIADLEANLSVEELERRRSEVDAQIQAIYDDPDYYAKREIYQSAVAEGRLQGEELEALNPDKERDQLLAQAEEYTRRIEQKQTEDWVAANKNEIRTAGGEELMADLMELARLQAKAKENAGQYAASGSTTMDTNASIAATELNGRLKAMYGDRVDQWMEYATWAYEQQDYKNRVADQTEIARNAPGLAAVGWTALSSPIQKLVGGAIGLVSVAGQRLEKELTGSATPVNYKNKWTSINAGADEARKIVSERIEKKTAGWAGSDTALGNIYSGAFNLGMSMLDSGVVVGMTALGLPSTVGTALLGGSAASSAMMDAVDKGATADQALFMGIISGLAEAFFEKYSIENLISMQDAKGLSNILKSMLVQGGVEASEEGATTLATTLADMMVMGDLSQLEITKQQYMEAGYSETDAERMATQEWIIGLSSDLIGGFLSGFLFGAGGAATNAMAQRSDYRTRGKAVKQTENGIQGLIADGLAADPQSREYKLAQRLQKKLDAGKQPTALEVGRLMYAEQEAAGNGFYAIQEERTEGDDPAYRIVFVGEDGNIRNIGVQHNTQAEAEAEAQEQGAEIEQVGTTEELHEHADRLEQETLQQEVQPVETAQPAAEVNEPTTGLTWAGDETAQAAPMTAIENEETGLQWAGNQKEAIINEQTEQTDRDDRSTAGNADYAPVQTGTAGGDGSRGNTARVTQTRTHERGAAASYYRSAVEDLGVKRVDIREVIPIGVEGNGVKMVPESAYDDEAKRAKEAAADKGLDLVLVVGNIPIMVENKERSVIGMIDFENGKIYVRADSSKQTVMETVNHELFHDAADRDATLVPRLIDFIKENYTYEEYSKIVDRYYRDYRDMYPNLEGEDLKEAVWEELLADAYAEYNRYGKETLPGLSEEVQKLTWAGEEKNTDRTDGGVKFSKSMKSPWFNDYRIATALYEALDHKDDGRDNLIKISEMPKYLKTLLEIDGDLYIYRNHAYENMVSREKAISDGRPVTRNKREIDFHDLGIEKMKKAISLIDDPTMVIATKTKEGNPAVIMILSEKGNNKAPLYCVISLYSNKSINGSFVKKPHIVLSVAERNYVGTKNRDGYLELINKAIDDGRIIAFNKKRGNDLSVIAQQARLGNITESFLKENLTQFQKEIKQFKKKNKIFYSVASETTEKRTVESMRDEVLESMPSDFSPTPHSVPRKSKEESKFAEKLTDEERAVVEQAMEKREKTEKQSIFDMTIEEMIIPKEGFTSTPAIDKLGVKVAGSVARYRSTEDLKAYVRAATLADKYLRNAVEQLKPTDKEIEVAKQLVDGPLDTLDLNPETIDIQKVTEIADFYAAKKSYWEDSLSQRKDEIRVMLQRIAKELFADSDKYAPNLKKFPILTKIVMNYKEAERLMREIFGDEQGQKIYDTVFHPIWINSVEAKRWQGGMLEKVQKFKDKDGKERALTLKEREFAQRIMEGQAVIEELQKLREGTRSKIAKAARALNEGKNLSEVSEEFGLDQGYQQGLAQQYADYLSMVEITENMDTTIMENAIKVYRQLYNDLYDAINDFMVSHGKPPIGFIKNYAPHFQKHEVQNALLNALSSMGLSQANVSQLPTDIAGRTADYKPIQRWNPHFQQRKGNKTDYDIQVGFERYIDYAAEVFFHTDDIMRVREIVNYYRSQYAGEAISEAIQNAQIDRYKDTEWKIEFLKKQGEIDPLKRTDDMSPKEINEKYEEYISKLYKQAEPQNLTKYSNFVTWLDDYANTLAGKQSWMDRGFEAFAGRDALRWSQQVVNAFAKANVAGNLSTVFNQIAQVPILQRDLGIYYELALMDVVTLKTRREGFSKSSDLLTDRKGIEGFAEMPTGKLLSWLFKPAELTDTLVATIAVRGKYRQLLAQNKGMTPEQALKEADNYGRRVMGSRAKGAKPLAFNNKNFLAAQFNMYQLEALNTLEYMRAEWPRQFRETAKKRGVPYAVAREAVKALLFMLSTFVINRLTEDKYGGTPAPLDILGWVLTFVSGAYDEDEEEFMQTLLDNILEKSSGERPFGTEPLETPEEGVSGLDWAGAYEDLKYNLVDEIPVVRNITQTLGMGDQSGAMAGVGEVFRSLKAGFTTLKDQLLRGEDETGLDWAGAGWKALSEFGSGASIFMPGGRQLKKTARGVTALIRGGMYSGYGENKRLQYPVEATAGNIVRGVMFGPSGFRETDEYYLDGKALSASQTQKAEALEENGVDIQQTYDLYQEYSDINENEDKELLTSIEAKAEKRNAIAEMDLNDWQKLEVYLQTLYTGNDKGRAKARAKYEALIGENVTWQQLTDLDNDYAALNEDADGDGEADMDSLEQGIAKRNTIAMMDLTDQQKLEVYDRYHLDRSADNYEETRKEFEAMLKAGLSWEEITAAHNTYARLNADDELTANQKATEYARWADEQGWNETQKTAIKERYMFWQMIPAEATKYEKFTEQGMSGSEAQRLIELQEKINDMGLTADKDADGKTIAGSKKEKVIKAIGQMNISSDMKDALYFAYGYAESKLDETPWH